MDKLDATLKFEGYVTMLRDACFNIAIWSFCFRYWNIANVMPKTVRAEPISLTYRVLSTSLLVVGLLANIIFPILYGYYSYKANSGYITDPDDPISSYEQYRKPYIMAKYSVGIL